MLGLDIRTPRLWMKLGRSRAWLSTAFPFAIGLALGGWPIALSVQLAAWCFILHLFICHCNNLADIEWDRNNPARGEQPLVTGSVSAIAALHWIALEVASLVAAGSAIFQPRESFTAMMLLLLIIVYGNFFQKRSAFFHPLLIDLLYGFCMGFPVVLVGSLLSVDGSTSILLGIGVGSIFALLNISSGNLKDLRYDLIDGAKTTAIVLGVRPKANAGVVERPFPALYVVVLYALAAVPLGVVVMLTFLRERTYEFVPIRLGLWGLAVALCLVALIDLRWRISRNPVPEDGQDEILGRSTFEVRDGSQGDPVFVSPAYAFALLGAMVVGTGSVAPKPGLGILLLGLMVAITAGLIGRESIQRRFS